MSRRVRLTRLTWAAMSLSASLLGCSRVMGLPPVPDSVTRRDAGLDEIEHAADEARVLARPLSEWERSRFATAPPADAIDRARLSRDRMARGDVQGGLRAFTELVEAARAIGATRVRIVVRHIVPNVLPVAIVLGTINLGTAILAEAAISFLGYGIPPPFPSWGGWRKPPACLRPDRCS